MYTICTLSVSAREKSVDKAIIRILGEHPEGMHKNELIQILVEGHITTKTTFYKNLPKYSDSKGKNIILLKKHGKRELCLPTNYVLITTEFNRKLIAVNDLLNFIAKNPDLGNAVLITKKSKRVKTLARTEILHKHQIIEFVDPQKFLKKKKMAKNKMRINVVPIGTRNSILKELPYYLVHRINSVYRSHSNKLKKELVKELFPIMNYCVEIFSRSISKNPLDAREVFGTLLHKIDDISNVSFGPYTVLANTAYISTREFEDVVWYYFFLVSLHFSNNLGTEGTKEQQVVSNFIHEFFPRGRSFVDFEEIKKKMKKFV